MMIFNKSIPRRTFLRGLGATVALPLLDSMIPAFGASADVAMKPALRLGFVYVPHGVIMDKWTPSAEGAEYELTPIMKPLTPFRDQMLALTGLAQKNAFPLPGEGGAFHSRATATFLTGVHPKATEGNDIRAGISVDQIAAKEFGKQTQLASLELALDSVERVGACEPKYTCAYLNTLAWRSPTTPVPTEDQPRAVFERLFGDSDTTDPAARLSRIHRDRSLLDSMSEDVAHFQKGLGPNDRNKLNEYLDAIRDVERRIQLAEEQASREVPRLDRPAGIPDSFDDYAKLMFDLQVLAYQADMTRVITFMIAHELSVRTYPQIGVSDPHHPLSHHRGDAKMIEKVAQIDVYHVKLFAYFLDKLRSTADGDGSLLDHSMIVYGSGISDGNLHLHDNLPVLLVGGGAGKIKGGRHLRYPKDTPLGNLYLTVLDMLGIPIYTLGDSTGKLDLLPI